jgi:hypothetical protein
MNNFCININTDVKVLNDDFDINTIKTSTPTIKHSKLLAEHFHQELHNFLADNNLTIFLAEAFHIPKFKIMTIHIDGGQTDYAKLNWIYGGAGSKMHWYRAKVTKNPEDIGVTAIGTRYEHFLSEEVELVHSQAVGCPSLVQVGMPHNVTNPKEDRICISAVLANKTTGKHITFNEAMLALNKYIISD